MTSQVTGVAATFVWLGMVVAISFLEAPLKFRAPGVTLAVGLGIGRLVFRALNVAEVVLAVVVIVAMVGGVKRSASILFGIAVVTLIAPASDALPPFRLATPAMRHPLRSRAC